MTPAEFKAWFDGFTEAFSGCPTKAQWARIKDRVAEIDGKAVTERVYVDRYWPIYRQYFDRIYCQSTGVATGVGVSAFHSALSAGNNLSGLGQNYNSMSAMNALGKADALSLSAS